MALCLFPWDVTCVSSLGCEAGRRTYLSAHAAGLGPPHNTFLQANILDMALEPARRVADSSSAQLTTHQLNNFSCLAANYCF